MNLNAFERLALHTMAGLSCAIALPSALMLPDRFQGAAMLGSLVGLALGVVLLPVHFWPRAVSTLGRQRRGLDATHRQR